MEKYKELEKELEEVNGNHSKTYIRLKQTNLRIDVRDQKLKKIR